MSKKAKLLLAYLAALTASHLWQGWGPGAGRQKEAASDGLPELSSGEAVVLLHAVGAGPEQFDELRSALPDNGPHAFAPRRDGESDWRRLAERLAAWEAEDGRPVRIHLVGVGYGGAEATLLAEELGDQAASLAVVSSALSPRLELLGDDRLNTALKAFTFGALWLVDKAVPHFGALDGARLGSGAAYRALAIDMEAVARSFERLGGLPILVADGEASRLARKGVLDRYLQAQPGARSVQYEGGRYAPVDAAARAFAGELTRLWAGSDGSGVETREGKPFEALPRIQMDLWFAGLLLAVATFASEDFACIGGGLLAASGAVPWWLATVGCLLGIFVGDLGIYLIGRTLGASALELPILRRLSSKEALARSARWFERRGIGLVVLTRFFPGSRVPTYFAAGVVGVGWVRFAFALLIASAIWTPILVTLAFWLGDAFLSFFEGLGVGAWLAALAFVIGFSALARLAVKAATWRGRRLLYSRWQRTIRWEFWPVWAVYGPVAFYIAWLALRFRSLTLPFSVNPCMPASGLVYESKIQILEHLQRCGAPVARFEAIPLAASCQEKLARLAAFMEREGLGFPIALKPDVGQRGQGVAIVEGPEEAEAFFREQNEDSIAQEYVGGWEYGVFYHRFASRDAGTVSSITDKRMVSVEGDGASTVEELILKDERAVLMARFFLKEYAGQLEKVPARGERFALARIGTHCRGALFLDGAAHITPELEAAVDAFSRKVEGFHFGRYDLRAPSPEALRRGEGIRIIELNGITSEPTNMYDPRHGPFFGWRALMRQWRLIFELAKENRLAGHEPVSMKFVLKLAWGHFRGVPSRDLS